MSLFDPRTATTTKRLDERMRGKLAASLDYIFSIDGVAASVQIDLPGLLSSVSASRQQPGMYGRYFDVVFALRGGNRTAVAALLEEMSDLATEPVRFSVKPLRADAMGPDAARYARILGRADAAVFSPPGAEDWDGFDLRVAAALSALAEVHPILAEEVNGLLVEVVGSVPASNGRSFGSASSLTLWGAAIMNLRQHATALDLMDGLVHEAAHHLLFGLAIDEPLVRNLDSERFTSPLRTDPRPMDGVVHATFVCARLHLLYEAVLSAGRHGAYHEPMLAQRLSEQKTRVIDGLATIDAHAVLTETGASVVESIRGYMADAA